MAERRTAGGPATAADIDAHYPGTDLPAARDLAPHRAVDESGEVSGRCEESAGGFGAGGGRAGEEQGGGAP
ncbi:Uncharacterised protein [Actinomadura madurae]|nr:Uncharacterised protein [Actinomadura madurae]